MKSKILSIVAISAVALTLSTSNAFAAGHTARPTKQVAMHNSHNAGKSYCGKSNSSNHRFKNDHNKRQNRKAAFKHNNNNKHGKRHAANQPMVKKGVVFKSFS